MRHENIVERNFITLTARLCMWKRVYIEPKIIQLNFSRANHLWPRYFIVQLPLVYLLYFFWYFIGNRSHKCEFERDVCMECFSAAILFGAYRLRCDYMDSCCLPVRFRCSRRRREQYECGMKTIRSCAFCVRYKRTTNGEAVR